MDSSALKKYRALTSSLQCVEEGRDEFAARLLILMESFELYFEAVIYSFRCCQAKDTTVGEGCMLASVTFANFEIR